MRFVPLIPVLALALPALARDYDVGVRVENGHITTWLADHDSGQYVAPERVWGAELINNNGDITIDEPGFFATDGEAPEGFKLGFDITRALRIWDVPGQHFDTIAPHTMTLSNPIFGSVDTPASDILTPGLSFLVPKGGFDQHFDQTLNGDTQGIYLLERYLWTGKPGVGQSEKFWVVFSYGLNEEEHGAAMQWVRDNLVPAPAGAWVVLVGVVVAGRRRR